MNELRQTLRFLPIIILATILSPLVQGAEFDIYGPQVELRRTQSCTACSKDLLVTHIPAGTILRCPYCDTEQERLADNEIRTEMLQICPHCNTAMSVHDYPPGSLIRCGKCGHEQHVLPSATMLVPAPRWHKELPEIRAEMPDPWATEDEKNEERIDIQMKNDEEEKPREEPVHQLGNMETGTLPPLPRKNMIVAASVNGAAISRREVERRALILYEKARQHIRPLPGTAKQKELADRMPQLRQEALNDLITEKLLTQEAKREGVEVPAEKLTQEAERYRQATGLAELDEDITAEIRRRLIFQQMLWHHTSAESPTIGSIQKYYDEHRDEFNTPPTVRLRCLTIYKDRRGRSPEAPAGEVMRRAQAQIRKSNFVNGSKAYSEDIFAKGGGIFHLGDSRPVALVDLALPLQRALEGAREGFIIGPLELASALVMIRVEELTGGKPRELGQVQQIISDRLARKARLLEFDHYIAQLRNRSEVVIY